MSYDSSWLKNFIAKKTIESWETKSSPYYMSSIPVDTAEEDIDYREIISPLRLRQWLQVNPIPGVKTIFDDVHKAKVTFIPDGIQNIGAMGGLNPLQQQVYPLNAAVSYIMETTKDAEEILQSNNTRRKQKMSSDRYATLKFFEALSHLDDEDLEDINIPLKVIVRLLAK